MVFHISELNLIADISHFSSSSVISDHSSDKLWKQYQNTFYDPNGLAGVNTKSPVVVSQASLQEMLFGRVVVYSTTNIWAQVQPLGKCWRYVSSLTSLAALVSLSSHN